MDPRVTGARTEEKLQATGNIQNLLLLVSGVQPTTTNLMYGMQLKVSSCRKRIFHLRL